MKKIHFTLILLILFFSCNKSLNDKVDQSALKTFLSVKLREIDSTVVLEKFTFIKLDTMSKKNQYYSLLNEMLNESEEYNFEINNLLNKVKSNRKLQSLYTDLSFSLWKSYKDDADDDFKKANEYFRKDSLLSIDLDKIQKLAKKADSLSPVMYTAKCFYILKKRDQSISKDTAYIKLDLDLNIIDNIEYSKQINNLYKPVSNFIFE